MNYRYRYRCDIYIYIYYRYTCYINRYISTHFVRMNPVTRRHRCHLEMWPVAVLNPSAPPSQLRKSCLVCVSVFTPCYIYIYIYIYIIHLYLCIYKHICIYIYILYGWYPHLQKSSIFSFEWY